MLVLVPGCRTVCPAECTTLSELRCHEGLAGSTRQSEGVGVGRARLWNPVRGATGAFAAVRSRMRAVEVRSHQTRTARAAQQPRYLSPPSPLLFLLPPRFRRIGIPPRPPPLPLNRALAPPPLPVAPRFSWSQIWSVRSCSTAAPSAPLVLPLSSV